MTLEALAGFLALDVLLDGLEHDPVRRATSLTGQLLDASFSVSSILRDVAIDSLLSHGST